MYERVNFSVSKDSIIHHNFEIHNSPYLFDYRQIGFLKLNNDYSNIKEGYEEYCLLVVMSGQMQLSYSGIEYSINPMQFAFFDMRNHFEMKPSKTGTAMYFSFFRGAALSTLYEDFSRNLSFVNESSDELVKCFDSLLSLAEGRKSNNVDFDIVEISCLLYKLIAVASKKLVDSTSKDEMDETLQYIKDHYKEDIDLDVLAKKQGYSKYFFIRKFKAKFGDTPVHFLASYRAKKTMEMLEDKNKKIEYAALANGFKDKRSFLRICKQNYGASPSIIRKKKA